MTIYGSGDSIAVRRVPAGRGRARTATTSSADLPRLEDRHAGADPVPHHLAAKAQVELAGGIPFMSDKDLKAALDKAGVSLIALFTSRRIPAKQPSASAGRESPA